jgi:hypothetical protein
MMVGKSATALRAIATMLVNSGWLGNFYGFDAWAANTDRHTGNLLISPPAAPWLIDHGRCFTGSNWKSIDLVANGKFRHRLREWLTPLLTEADQKKFSAQAAELAHRLNELDVKSLGMENRLPALLGENDFNTLVTFLDDRRVHVPNIAATALNQSMMA